MKRMLVRLMLVLAVGGFFLASVGCETWKGVGKDVEKGGQAIQGDDAKEVQK